MIFPKLFARVTEPGRVDDASLGAVELRDVSFTYPGSSQPVLSSVQLRASAGQWVSLIGPNGCGKSTLLRCIGGLSHCTGELAVGGIDPRMSPRAAVARRVALMPQQPVVPEGMLIREYIALGRAPYKGRGQQVVDDVVVRLGLEKYVSRRLTDVSGGELQRVVLARALAQQPTILLLDEPTSALDIGKAQQVMELVDDIRKESKLTVIAALHDLTLAAQYSDRVVFLEHGCVIADGEPSDALTEDRIEGVYEASVRVLEQKGAPVIIPERPVGS